MRTFVHIYCLLTLVFVGGCGLIAFGTVRNLGGGRISDIDVAFAFAVFVIFAFNTFVMVMTSATTRNAGIFLCGAGFAYFVVQIFLVVSSPAMNWNDLQWWIVAPFFLKGAVVVYLGYEIMTTAADRRT